MSPPIIFLTINAFYKSVVNEVIDGFGHDSLAVSTAHALSNFCKMATRTERRHVVHSYIQSLVLTAICY